MTRLSLGSRLVFEAVAIPDVLEGWHSTRYSDRYFQCLPSLESHAGFEVVCGKNIDCATAWSECSQSVGQEQVMCQKGQQDANTTTSYSSEANTSDVVKRSLAQPGNFETTRVFPKAYSTVSIIAQKR